LFSLSAENSQNTSRNPKLVLAPKAGFLFVFMEEKKKSAERLASSVLFDDDAIGKFLFES